jgi:CBS domain-containing protein
MHVRNLMTQNPQCCRAEEMTDAAARVMWETDCGVVPIVDERERVVGVITDRDICMAAYTRGEPLSRIPIASAMARQVISCRASDPVEVAEKAMREGRVRRLPVVDDDGRLVGVLSLNDLAREALHDGRGEAPGLADVTTTLAAICEPRARLAAPSDLASPVA